MVVASGLAWAASPATAEPGSLAGASADRSFELTESPDAVVLTPTRPDGVGLVVLAGARVEPAAYAAKLSGLAEEGTTVVIARPILNFAIAEFRPLTDFTRLGPGVDSWVVGGHSLGGVRACGYAASARDARAPASETPSPRPAGSPSPEIAGLLLLGSYCAVDLADSALPVLSLGGGADGLSTPAKIADAAALLPADTRFAELAGASHAQFGDYGTQAGDGTPTASDAEVREWMTEEVRSFLAGIRS